MLLKHKLTLQSLIPQRNGVNRDKIRTLSMHLEYTIHMRGINVANQLRAFYCIQNDLIHGDKRYFFLLDMAVVIMFMIYVDKCKKSLALAK